MSQSDNVAQKLPNFVFECLNKSFSTNCKRSYYFQAYFLILFVFEKKMLFCNFEKIIKNIIWKRSSSSLHRINCFFFGNLRLCAFYDIKYGKWDLLSTFFLLFSDFLVYILWLWICLNERLTQISVIERSHWFLFFSPSGLVAKG